MIRTGLTSVTFRQKSVGEIVDMAAEAHLDAIEWGGDIHVPSGDRAAAERALRLTREAGLAVSAYGSYYRAGTGQDFDAVLRTAGWLDCRLIRVWAGDTASAECSESARSAVTEDLARIVERAAREGCRIATEYHARTLTDTLPSALRLLGDVPGLRTFWQPPVGSAPKENLEALERLRDRVESIHVYHWAPALERRPLSEGGQVWRAYFEQVRRMDGVHTATLEFVKDDSVSQMLSDAKALRNILERQPF